MCLIHLSGHLFDLSRCILSKSDKKVVANGRGGMNYQVQFSESVLQGIQDLVDRSFGPDDLAKAVTDAYGPKAVDVAMQIAEKLYGPTWIKNSNAKSDAIVGPAGQTVSPQRDGGNRIDGYPNLRGKFSFSDAYGDEAVPVARTIAASRKVFEWAYWKKGRPQVRSDPPRSGKLSSDLDSHMASSHTRAKATGVEAPAKQHGAPDRSNSAPTLAWYAGKFSAYCWRSESFRSVFWATSLCIGIFALVWAVNTYSEYSKTEAYKQEKASIGSSASIAGAMWAGAIRSCRIIGINEVRDCAKNSGPLLQDTSAKALAEIAVRQTDEYFATCGRHHTNQYCVDLVNRAYWISLRTE